MKVYVLLTHAYYGFRWLVIVIVGVLVYHLFVRVGAIVCCARYFGTSVLCSGRAHLEVQEEAGPPNKDPGSLEVEDGSWGLVPFTL